MMSPRLLCAVLWTLPCAWCCAQEPASTNAPAAETVQAQKQVPVYSVNPPHDQRGYFPAGARLEILEPPRGGFVRVRFRSADGRVIEGLCRSPDLGIEADHGPAPAPPPALPAAGKPVPGSVYESADWLEDYEGHKQAIEAQAKYDNQMLICFYADWNDECVYLWENLLSDREFRGKTKQIIKVRINPEHGKDEGRLANQYRLRKYPTTLVVDKPHAKPRRIELVYWSFGKLRTPNADYALAEITGAVEGTRPWESARTASTGDQQTATGDQPSVTGRQ